MKPKSHVDLCLFIRYIHLGREQIPSNVHDLLEGKSDTGRLLEAWLEQYYAVPKLFFHETFHYWQGLRLPFLHWYARWSFISLLRGFRELSNASLDFHRWKAAAPQLNLISLQRPCYYFGKTDLAVGASVSARPSSIPEFEVHLSPLDLLEGQATVAEWQIVIGDPVAAVNPLLFSRWCKRNPSYTTAFRFVSRCLEDESLALRLFNPLISAAFETTDPVRAFVTLLAVLKGKQKMEFYQEFTAQKEPCRWIDFFHTLLDEIEYDLKPNGAFGLAPTLNQTFFRLNLAAWVNAPLAGQDLKHPFLSEQARRWFQFEKNNGQYGWLLPQIAWVDGPTFDECYAEFQPPLTFTRFEKRNGKFQLIITGPENIMADLKKEGVNLADLLALYGAVRRAVGVHFEPDQRLCYHTRCPEYSRNFCNTYPIIPRHFTECGFPSRMRKLQSKYRRS